MPLLIDENWLNAINSALVEAHSTTCKPNNPAEPTDQVELVVSGTKGGKVATRWSLENAWLHSVRVALPDEEPATLTMPIKAAELQSLLAGELDPAVAFMRGDLKPEGPTGSLLEFLAALNRPETKAALALFSAGFSEGSGVGLSGDLDS